MIVAADTVENDACLWADVCIVGGGAAGISLALSLSGQGLKILLLESGRTAHRPPPRLLDTAEVSSERQRMPPDNSLPPRRGSSTTTWGDRCVPFDPIDFESRRDMPYSGWPISYSDLLPFYPQANALSEAGRFSYDADEALGPAAPPMFRGFHSTTVRTDSLERYSCPTDFGKRYEKRLRLARDVTVLLGAICTAVRLECGGRAVDELEVSTLSGRRFKVSPRAAVLAAGGLETARLLLASTDVARAGIGNDNDVVGRYCMRPLVGNVGSLAVRGAPQDVRHGYELTPEGVYCRRRLAIAPEQQRRHGLANTVAYLHFPRITDPAHHDGVLSGLFLAGRLASDGYGNRLADGTTATAGFYARHMLNLVSDPVDTAAFLAHWLTRRTLAQRKLPSVIMRNRSNRFSLEMHAGQMPRPDSRVMLSDRRDLFGTPQLRVDWRYSRADVESADRMLQIIAREFERTGTGTLEYDRARLEEELAGSGTQGGPHIGTTRMGSDVQTSVVNSDCQVHSVRNLFIAGSAVFPTSSQASPTLTVVALALRLGKHLSRRLAPKPRVHIDLTGDAPRRPARSLPPQVASRPWEGWRTTI